MGSSFFSVGFPLRFTIENWKRGLKQIGVKLARPEGTEVCRLLSTVSRAIPIHRSGQGLPTSRLPA